MVSWYVVRFVVECSVTGDVDTAEKMDKLLDAVPFSGLTKKL